MSERENGVRERGDVVRERGWSERKRGWSERKGDGLRERGMERENGEERVREWGSK